MFRLKRYSLVLVAIALVSTISLAACSSAAPSVSTQPAASAASPAASAQASSSAASSANGQPYVIGALYSQTGNMATFDVVAANGAKLAVEDINKAGGINGHPLKLVMYDPESKPEEVVSLGKKLIEQDHVLAIVGPSSGAQSGPLMPVINAAKIPDVAQQGYLVLTSKDGYAFSTVPSALVSTEAVIAWAAKHGIKKIGMLTRADIAGQQALPQTKPFLDKYGIQLVGVEKYLVTDTDMTDQLSKLKAEGAQAIFNNATGRDVAITAKNFKQLQMPGYLLIVAPTLDLLQQAGDAASVMYGSTLKCTVWDQLPDSDPAKKALAAFAKEYKAKYNLGIEQFSVAGYDAVQEVAQALKSVGPDPVKMRDYLENTTFNGLGGPDKRSKDNHMGPGIEGEVVVKADVAQHKWVIAP